MSASLDKFNEIEEKYADVSKGKMFGADCLKLPNKKVAVCLKDDILIIKLDKNDQEDALMIKGTQMFDPMGGRPMNGWVEFPEKVKDHWDDFVDRSISFVRSL